MALPSLIESFDLLRFSEPFHGRLVAAQEGLNAKRGLKREKEWMASAVELLTAEREPVAAMLDRARGLPELADVAYELASGFQEVWVDALEKLLAGITFHAGSRSPVIESLFPHQKFPALRRANKEVATQYAAEFERRLKSGYVTRMFAGDDFAFARPVVDQIASAYAQWQACFAPPPLPEEDAAKLREELPTLAKRLDQVMAQVRLLAEAALLPVNGAYDASGLNAKPRKRSARAEAPEPTAEATPVPEAAPEMEPASGQAAPEEKPSGKKAPAASAKATGADEAPGADKAEKPRGRKAKKAPAPEA